MAKIQGTQLTLAEAAGGSDIGAILSAPEAAVISHLGAKWRNAPKILRYFPPHSVYVEAYGGSFAVGLQKKPAKLTIYNDLNTRTRNLFRQLRDHPDRLIAAIDRLDYDKETFDRCWAGSPRRIEDAAMYFRYAGCSYNGAGTRHNSGYLASRAKRAKRKGTNHLWAASERLQGVEILGEKALKVIDLYDGPGVLFYLDPVYLNETRGAKDKRHKNPAKSATRRQYAYEMSDADHMKLFERVNQCQGMVIVSGYPSELYKSTFEAHGWTRIDLTDRAISGAPKIDSLWLNPQAIAAL